MPPDFATAIHESIAAAIDIGLPQLASGLEYLLDKAGEIPLHGVAWDDDDLIVTNLNWASAASDVDLPQGVIGTFPPPGYRRRRDPHTRVDFFGKCGAARIGLNRKRLV